MSDRTISRLSHNQVTFYQREGYFNDPRTCFSCRKVCPAEGLF